MATKTYGTFTKKGEAARTAMTPGEAVSLLFTGWAEVQPAPEPEPEATASAKSDKSRS
jgi:hypothetical protein